MRIFLLVLALLPGTCVLAQESNEFSNPYFKFSVHNDFKWELLNDRGHYKWSTVYISVMENKNFKTVKDYYDAFVSRLESNTTARIWMDTLAGWPVPRYKTYKKDKNVWVTDSYAISNGRQLFLLSVLGYQGDSSVIYSGYKQTQQSFVFKTRAHGGKGFFIQAPQIWNMDKNNYYSMLWSHISQSDHSSVPLGIRFTEQEGKAEDIVQVRKKALKKDDYEDLSDSSFTLNNVKFIKLTGYKRVKKVPVFKTINYLATGAGGRTLWIQYTLDLNTGRDPFESSFENLLHTLEIQ